MWFKAPANPTAWTAAEEHLRLADPVLARIIERAGACRLHRRRDYFVALCQAIFTQQVSTAVANVLFERFRRLFPAGRPTPKRVLDTPDDALASVGLSRQKRTYLRDLAARFARKQVPTARFSRMTDEQIIESLLSIKGVGRWTAEMFLIFVLNRPDLLPVDDLGVRKAVQVAYTMAELPTAEQLVRMAEPWRPWRTVATWYLWRSGALPPHD